MSDKKLEDRVIRFDWAMKRILRNKANFAILNGFLTVVLGEKVEIVELLESESNMDSPSDKFNRVDIKARNSKGQIVLVEVQNNHDITYFHRILYGTSKAITEHIHIGQGYGEVKKVYSINIVYFDCGQGDDYLYKGTTIFRGLHNPDDVLTLSEVQRKRFLVESPTELFPEYYILRVNNFNQVATTPLEEWMSFLKSSCIPETFTAPGLSEARRQLQIDQMSHEEYVAYEHMVDFAVSQNALIESSRLEGEVIGEARGLSKGIAQGRAEGMAQGRAEERLGIARNMLSLGMSPEQVSQVTGLTTNEIEQMASFD